MISVSSVLCDRPCKRLPCLHEQAFAGQRTADGFAVSCPLDRGRTRKNAEERGRFPSPIFRDPILSEYDFYLPDSS